MNDSNSRYIEAMTKLYGSNQPHTCARDGCKTVILKGRTHCIKHAPSKAPDAFKYRKSRRGKR